MARLVTTDDENIRDKHQRLYRPVKFLPFELREHCVIYFEEHLCKQTSIEFRRRKRDIPSDNCPWRH